LYHQRILQELQFIEQNLIKECVGSQDQIASSYGGFNHIEFYRDDSFVVEPIIVNQKRKSELNDHLMLFFTGISRFSSEVAENQISNMSNCSSQMNELQSMVDDGIRILLNTNTPLEDFGLLLDSAWQVKRSLSDMVSNTKIDNLYKTAIEAGAIGGKVMGAGGGGFVLFYVKPENQVKVKEALAGLTYVPFKFENTGSKVVVHQPNGF